MADPNKHDNVPFRVGTLSHKQMVDFMEYQKSIGQHGKWSIIDTRTGIKHKLT